MKLGILGPFPPFRGGIATFNYHLATHLGRMMGDVFPLNYEALYPPVIFPGRSQLDESRIPFSIHALPVFHPYKPWRWPSNMANLRKIHMEGLVCAWWSPLMGPGLSMVVGSWRRRTRKPLAVVCHNVQPHESIPLSRFWTRRFLRKADVLVAHWQGDADDLTNSFPSAVVCKLFHPVYDLFPEDADLTREHARRQLNIPSPGRKVLLFFGLIRPYKGLETLLNCLPQLVQKWPDLCLILAGEPYENIANYQHWLSPWQEKGNVMVHDSFIPNEMVHVYFKAADAIVLPYHHATQSGVVPLAYRWLRGVIATRVGGLPEMVSDGVSGVLIPPRNPEAMVAGIQRFFSIQSEIECNLLSYIRPFGFDRYLHQLLQALELKSTSNDRS